MSIGGIVLCILSSLVLLIILTCLFLSGSKNEHDQKLNDETQEKAIQKKSNRQP